MRWFASFTALTLATSLVSAQAPAPVVVQPQQPATAVLPPATTYAAPGWDSTNPPLFPCAGCCNQSGDRLEGTHKFDNFIGFISNPLQNIDPRAVTELWPVFGSSWFNTVPALPSGDVQLYGAGLYVALSERLSVGLNQGGYAVAHFDQGKIGQFVDRFGKLQDRRQFAGQREGWLNLGGFVQYTFIENEADQFLVTGGLRWVAPSGSQDIFQGNGPARLAPYLTAGKGIGNFHVLATTGYNFGAGSADVNNDFFYANTHLDYQLFGWLYPLVEFNWTYHTTSADVSLPTRDGFLDFGNFSGSGNILSMAVGANAVLIRNKLEFGAVYTRSLATQRNFDFDGLIVKMVYRY